MYKGKCREQKYLFEELTPFGGALDEGNRWLKIRGLIPWNELEREYAKYFSDRGRPGLDGRLVVGLFLLKHMTSSSDEEVVLELQENVYWQAFCWMESFEIGKKLNASSLTKIRHKLGPKFVRELEEKTYKALIDKRIIKARGLMVDGTVVPEKIKYPNDISLLNDVREWLVKQLKEISAKTGEKIRTYKRKARKTYLNFSKKKQKSRKIIKRAKRQMLQYAGRNIRQLKERMHEIEEKVRPEIERLLEIAQRIYEQQYYMYKEDVRKVNDRIISWWREYVRPIKRGKGGGKNVEFGPKVSISHVDGMTFVDEIRYDNYSEAYKEVVEKQIKNYEERFHKKPPSLIGDQLYGSRQNREMLKVKGVREGFKKLGRKSKKSKVEEAYIKRKQRQRNQIEGAIGTAKEHYGLNAIRYHYPEGGEMWIRLGMLAKNLKVALARVS